MFEFSPGKMGLLEFLYLGKNRFSHGTFDPPLLAAATKVLGSLHFKHLTAHVNGMKVLSTHYNLEI